MRNHVFPKRYDLRHLLAAMGYLTLPTAHTTYINVVDSAQVGSNPNTNPFCGRKIRATRHREGSANNVTQDVTVVDRCTGCKVYDLDFSPDAFEEMADQVLGRVDVTWAFLD